MYMNLFKRLNIKIIIAVALMLLLVIKSTKKPTIPEPSLSIVVVQQPQLLKMTEYITKTGNTVAYQSVDLVARIEGYLEAIEFIDGTVVQKGRELFIIEPLPYIEQLNGAIAAVDAQKAIYAYDSAEYTRQQRMYKQNATSLNNVEKWLAKSKESTAEIAKAVANAEIAKINYSYTHINAPFVGRIGRHLVDIGNLVGNGVATNLATIEQIDPIYVYFNLNEIDLIKLRHLVKSKEFKPDDIHKVPVYVAMQNETGFHHQGYLDFINTGLNASTGTIEFRALLKNRKYILLPGLFVQVRIPITAPTLRLTVPDYAVQNDQRGSYLMVVDPNNIVATRRVIIGGVEQNQLAIVKGLEARDRVIVSGLQNAIPGHKVAVIMNEKRE